MRMKLGLRTLWVALSFTIGATLTGAQPLSVVVEANGAPSRDAHFNWVFESSGGGDVQVGQFACGSYWVAPANGDTGVTVISLSGKTDDPNWHDLISCDADPITESHGLLDGSNGYGNYNSAENIIPNLPITYTPSSGSCVSLVAAMQRNEEETSKGGTKGIQGEVVDAYCVITVLPEVPANGGNNMIRPNITGATKEFLTWDDFDLERIRSYSFIDGYTPEQWETVRIRWSHSTEVFGMGVETSPGVVKHYSEGGRAFRSHLLVSNYAGGLTQSFNSDLLALLSSETNLEVVKPALAAMLSYGLDIYHGRYGDGSANRKTWASGAGQWGGQYLPPVFLAALEKEVAKGNELKKVAIHNHGEDKAELGPQELRQITRGVTGVLLWGDYNPFIRNGNAMIEGDWRYWSDFNASDCFDGAVGTCSSSKGKKTAADPYGYTDGPANKPGSSYMSVSFGGVRGLAAMMILMPSVREIVNTDDPIEYADRVTRHGLWTAPDPVATPSIEDQTNGCTTWWSASGCADWGVTWGADPSDIRFAIEDGVGRFTSMHGQPASTGYESSRAKDNWESIMSLYDGKTFEDWAVPLGTLVSPEIFFEWGSSPKAHMKTPNVLAEIRYTLDGSDPTSSSSLYTDPVVISDGTEVRAKAFQSGKTASAIQAKTFGTDVTPPSIPESLVSNNVNLTEVSLSWNASVDDFEVSGYRIYVDGESVFSIADTNATVSGLDPSTVYAFSVTAYDRSNNESDQSSSILVTTLEDVVPPTAPIRLAVLEVTSTTIELTWYAAGDNVGISGYNVYVNEADPLNVADTKLTIAGLNPQTTYSISVSSLDTSLNESVLSQSVQVTTEVGTGSSSWLGFVPDGNGDVDTGDWMGWVNVKRNPWGWSYALESWVYARGTDPVTAGAWIYMSR